MKRIAEFFFLTALVCFLSLAGQAAELPLPANEKLNDPVAGKRIVQEFLNQRPPENQFWYGTLHMRGAKGRRTRVPVRYTTVLDEDGWAGIYETKKTGELPAEKLIIRHQTDGRQEFFWGQAQEGNEVEDLRLLDEDEIYRPFAQSDFWILDLGLHFFRWPEQILVEKGMRKGRSSRVIASIHPAPEPRQYSKVLTWLDYETNQPIVAEAYDAGGKLMKVFSIGSVKKIDGQWQVKELEMRNEQDYSRTRLEFLLESPAAPAGR